MITQAWLVVALCLGGVVRLTRLVTEDVAFRPFRRWVITIRPAADPDANTDEDWLVYLIHCRWCASIWISAAVCPVTWLWWHHWFIQIPLLGLTASLLAGLSARWE